jgi:putative zinc finger protein
MKTGHRRPADLEPGEEELFESLRPAAELRPDGGRACPGADRLQAAAEGVLPEEAAQAVARHLAECPPCRLLSDELAAWEGPELSAHEQERLWRMTRARIGTMRPRRPRVWALPAVAAALLAAIPAWIVWRSGRTDPGRPPGGSGSSSAPTQALVLPLDKLAPLTPPGAAITWRSSGDAFERDLGQALEPYVAGDLQEAVRRLGPLAAKHPQAAAPALYLGVSHLLLDQPAAARAALERAPREPKAFWTPHLEWYLAVACERTGERARAARLARDICAAGGEYAGRACTAGRALPSGSE